MELRRGSFVPAVCSTSGRIDAEFLRLLFYNAHRESEEFFKLAGRLAQPNQNYFFSKRAAFYNGLKNRVGDIIAKASALRLNLNLLPLSPLSLAPLPATRTPITSTPLISPTTPSPTMA